MARMTKLSVENLRVADCVKIELTIYGYLVAVSREGNVAYLSDASAPIVYSSEIAARRAVKRLRPDLEPVSI